MKSFLLFFLIIFIVRTFSDKIPYLEEADECEYFNEFTKKIFVKNEKYYFVLVQKNECDSKYRIMFPTKCFKACSYRGQDLKCEYGYCWCVPKGEGEWVPIE